jgi:hypothetical protein
MLGGHLYWLSGKSDYLSGYAQASERNRIVERRVELAGTHHVDFYHEDECSLLHSRIRCNRSVGRFPFDHSMGIAWNESALPSRGFIRLQQRAPDLFPLVRREPRHSLRRRAVRIRAQLRRFKVGLLATPLRGVAPTRRSPARGNRRDSSGLCSKAVMNIILCLLPETAQSALQLLDDKVSVDQMMDPIERRAFYWSDYILSDAADAPWYHAR